MPQVVPDALACPGCKKPLPESARFCPACGASAPGVPCPRCGQSAVGSICPRCGGATGAKTTTTRACDKCGEPLGTGDRFCRRCGAALPGASKSP
jgi:predicted amidophosphoribosyltransferase